MEDSGSQVCGFELQEMVVCKYGAKCYRQNPEHREKFWHPPQEADVVAKLNSNLGRSQSILMHVQDAGEVAVSRSRDDSPKRKYAKGSSFASQKSFDEASPQKKVRVDSMGEFIFQSNIRT